jgi:hypothetical protein
MNAQCRAALLLVANQTRHRRRSHDHTSRPADADPPVWMVELPGYKCMLDQLRSKTNMT